MTDYREKYFDLQKTYHQLHAVLSDLTINLQEQKTTFNLNPAQEKVITDAINQSAVQIYAIDSKFRALIRVNNQEV